MKRLTSLSLIILAFCPAEAQTWTVRQCMQYAVAHNHEVKRAELELDNYKAGKTAAIGGFLPAVEAGIGAQYNFGRAIDPETNGYTDVSTFYNGYSLQSSLPVFDGFGRLHALRAAKASVLMGRQQLRQQQDQTALSVLQAFVNVAYLEGMVKMAGEKIEETSLLLRQTQVLEEVGRRSMADVAQVEAQKAEADYDLSRQQNLLAAALLELKMNMAFPMADTLAVSLQNSEHQLPAQDGDTQPLPMMLQAHYQVQASRHEWRQARAALLPALSLSAGLSTTYFKTLHSPSATSFSSQFNNNMGEYLGATLSIPLFNRLRTLTTIRRARNNYRMAQETYEQKQQELEKLRREAWQDWQAYLKQTEQMQRKVEADSMAYQLTRRQYEEGLATAIDLHATSSALLQSRATLLQCRLMAMVKQVLTRYYQGETIWTE
ncbi:MAG: TolC family protein [Prevotella sp.]|nr:TolC family protein [Prevotella sp.]